MALLRSLMKTRGSAAIDMALLRSLMKTRGSAAIDMALLRSLMKSRGSAAIDKALLRELDEGRGVGSYRHGAPRDILARRCLTIKIWPVLSTNSGYGGAYCLRRRSLQLTLPGRHRFRTST